ncbi:MAG: hypothetical protein EA374_03085 [Acholeplasmatales bacterium]|nr:MAG: hypothetical protein EA374_03085 [Acholeplasmatales bacterium]
MMEFMREIFEWLVLAALAGLLILSIRVLWLSRSIKQYFVNRKYKVETLYEHDPLHQEETYAIRIFNNNVSDTRIVAVGYFYKDRTIDYYASYLKQIGSSPTSRVVIPSREAIKVTVDGTSLMEAIEVANAGKRRIKTLRCFVTDVFGMTTTIKARKLKKIIKRHKKEKTMGLKQAKKTRIKAAKKERKALRRQRRKDRLNRFKNRCHRALVKVKTSLRKSKRGM